MTAKCCDRPSPVGVEVQGDYDGVLFYSCAICHKNWHRFEEGHYLHERARKYVDQNPIQRGVDP